MMADGGVPGLSWAAVSPPYGIGPFSPLSQINPDEPGSSVSVEEETGLVAERRRRVVEDPAQDDPSKRRKVIFDRSRFGCSDSE